MLLFLAFVVNSLLPLASTQETSDDKHIPFNSPDTSNLSNRMTRIASLAVHRPLVCPMPNAPLPLDLSRSRNSAWPFVHYSERGIMSEEREQLQEQSIGASLSSKDAIKAADVELIFASLNRGTPPPAHLPFKIIEVDSNDFEFSPPSHKFEGKIRLNQTTKC